MVASQRYQWLRSILLIVSILCLINRPAESFSNIVYRSNVLSKLQYKSNHASIHSVTQLSAKKKGVPKAKGFGKIAELEPTASEFVTDPVVANGAVEDDVLTVEPVSAEPMNADDIFKKYGIATNPKAAGEKIKDNKKKAGSGKDGEAVFGENVMANIPMDLQAKIDSILVTGTFLALSFVVLSGIGISLGAFKVVFPQVEISQSVDDLIVNVLSPSFTPGLGVFFFFSITFGLFKFAQVSSSQTVYKE